MLPGSAVPDKEGVRFRSVPLDVATTGLAGLVVSTTTLIDDERLEEIPVSEMDVAVHVVTPSANAFTRVALHAPVPSAVVVAIWVAP